MKPIGIRNFLTSGIQGREEWAAVMQRAENYMIEITGDFLKLSNERYLRTGARTDDYTAREEYPELLAYLHNARVAMMLDAQDLKEKLEG